MATVHPPTFAALLQRHRHAAGLTPAALAARAGYSVRYIEMLERGTRAPSGPARARLAAALGSPEAERVALVTGSQSQDATPAPRSPPERTETPAVHTFLFCDVRGYTSYAVAHGDEATARLAIRFAAVAREETAAHGGQVIEVEGDGALAVFASARQALRAAVALQARFAQVSTADSTLPLRVGVGLDAGEALPVEGGYRGLALNLGARLCALAGPGEVLASSGVIHLAGILPDLAYSERGPVALKGFAEPVRVIQVRPAALEPPNSASEPAPGAPLPSDVPAPGVAPPSTGGFLGTPPDGVLIGRAREVALLDRHLAGDGPPVLLLAGEPGIGKTRLLREAEARARAGGWSVLAGGCTRRGGQEPFAPLVEALAGRLRGRPSGHARRDLDGCAWLVRLLPELAESGFVSVPTWSLSPEQERRLMFAAAGRYLANIAGPTGTLLVLDDLQWAGPDALDLLAALPRAAASPLRVVGAYRDTEVGPRHPLAATQADLGRDGLIAEVALRPLTQREGEDLLNALLEGADDEAVIPRVAARCGGVPFFLVSCARGLRSGTPQAGGEWFIPWDAEQSVRQRVATLPAAAQELLSVAAVVGRAVPGALLTAVAPESEDETLSALEATCHARLLVERGEDAYQFAHDLIREVVENDLSAARRRVLHRRVAEALERGAVACPASVLAYHYGLGGERARAIIYLLRAGDHAEAVYAQGEAEHQYRMALELARQVGDRAREAESQEKLGGILYGAARYDQALEALEGAVAAYRVVADLEGQRRSLARIGRTLVQKGKPEEGIARLTPEINDLDKSGDVTVGMARLCLALAHLYSACGRYDDQLASTEKAVALARTLRDDWLLVQAEKGRAIALLLLGHFAEPRAILEGVVPLAEAAGDLGNLVDALSGLATIHGEIGEFVTSRAYSERAVALAERQSDPMRIAWLVSARGESAFYLGAWGQARADFERALAMGRQIDRSWSYTYALVDMAMLRLALGEWDVASRYIEEGLPLAEGSQDLQSLRAMMGLLVEHDLLDGHPEMALPRITPLLDRPGLREWHVNALWPLMAWAHLDLGEASRAEVVAAQAIDRTRTQGHRVVLVEALRVAAMVATRAGRWGEAAGALDEALALARAMPYPYAEARALYTYGQLHARHGAPRQASERLREGLAICRRLGERLYAERIERALADLDAPTPRGPRATVPVPEESPRVNLAGGGL